MTSNLPASICYILYFHGYWVVWKGWFIIWDVQCSTKHYLTFFSFRNTYQRTRNRAKSWFLYALVRLKNLLYLFTFFKIIFETIFFLQLSPVESIITRKCFALMLQVISAKHPASRNAASFEVFGKDRDIIRWTSNSGRPPLLPRTLVGVRVS